MGKITRRVDAPVLEIYEVFHVGHLKGGKQAPTRAKRSTSFEGPGLSVSLVPTAWRAIARRGGSPLFALEKPDGSAGQFADLTGRNVLAFADILVEQGLIVPRDSYFVMLTDEDGNEAGELEVESLERALEEADGDEDIIRKGIGFRPTKALRDWWARYFTGDIPDVVSIAALAWLESETDLDGAWWNELLDPVRLSAPRGVIFRTRLKYWSAFEVDWSEAPDYEDEDGGW